MERNIALFSGTSNTFGLGVELEFRPKYNDHNWLEKNGVILPLVREPEDKIYWKKYRWPKLVSDALGLEEFNIHDHNTIQIGGNAIETIWSLVNENEDILNILKKTKYIFLEISYSRWWEKNLHGSNDGRDYPNTFQEILDLLNNPKSDKHVVKQALLWVQKYDINLIWKESFETYKKIKTKYPEIQFVLLPWNGDYKEFKDETNGDMIDMKNYLCIADYINTNKLRVGDVAMAYNGNYKYNFKDEHASSLGHKNIANIVLNHINKNEDLEVYNFGIKK